jgi:hypothetical protein
MRRAADAHLAHEGRGDASNRKSRGLMRGAIPCQQGGLET